ncbi:ComEC/Rec2 family competence protein [Paracoccus methylovorus]|uniref:ComEC/Rec2 family competence protein n=1 Tax=Paracoccus methylovorus TaxID=2812658 RepID=A0ABX7JP11_9RHOB|nr:ComEC/Rec2 family competence protein [Paracoccus methylovorus]
MPAPAGGTQRASIGQRPSINIRAGLLPWVPFWLSLGIGGWFLLPNEPGSGFYASLSLIGGFCVLLPVWTARLAEDGRFDWIWADRLRLAAFALLLTALGAGLAGGRAHMVAAPVLGFRYYGPIEGRVIGIDRSSRDRMRLLLDQVGLHGVAPSRTPERVRISLLTPQDLPVPGQRVMLTAHLGPPSGPSEPGGFDFRRMAWFGRLGAVGYARTPVMTVEQPADRSTLVLHRIRMSLSEAMRERIGGQSGAVSAALMTGDRSGIAEHTNQIMRDSNLYHIVSISGLHMSMLAGFIYAALRLCGVVMQGLGGIRAGPTHKFAAAGALCASAMYLWLSGGGVATERSFIMVAIMLLAIMVDRRAVSLRTVAVAASIVLVLGPEALTEPGFQMSFAATVALILMHEPWLKLSGHLPSWSRPVLMLFASSFVAGMVTAPIAAAHFGRMTQYGLLANMLVVPVVGTLVMPGGVFAALLAPIGLAQPALWVMGLGTDWMLAVAKWISDLDSAVTLFPTAPRAVLPLMAIGAMLVLLGAPSGAGNRTASLIFRRGLGAALLAAAALLWLNTKRPDILISAQGDAVAVLTPAGRAPSKPRGGNFAVENWLKSDGDIADQAIAAERVLWQGAAANRRAELNHAGIRYRIGHLTGKAVEQEADTYCNDGDILVANRLLNTSAENKCLILDKEYLEKHGAVAIFLTEYGLKTVSVDTPDSGRFWR